MTWQIPAATDTARKNNKYGNRIAALGQTYSITYTQTKQDALRFVVDSIKVDSGCDDSAAKPTNGYFLVITLRVQLGAVTAAALSDGSVGFNTSDWTAFDAKDVAQVGTDQFDSDCLSDSLFPFTADLRAGQVYRGKVALDVSATKGTVVLMNNLSGGWVFNFG